MLVLIYVPDAATGLVWYQKAFPDAILTYLSEFDLLLLNIIGFTLEVVQSDEKASAGKNGIVLYWLVENINLSLTHFERLAAKLYRGSMNIENNLVMCQVEDPFGNLIGLRGESI